GPHLRRALRDGEMFARLGGDEFAVLVPGADREHAAKVAKGVQSALEVPFVIEGQFLELGASIGIVLYPEHGADSETLLRRADIAMYEAKRTSKGYGIYAKEHDLHSPDRLALLGELR